MKRLIEETACQHSYFGGCTFKTDSGDPCPGGTSKPVAVDWDKAVVEVIALLGLDPHNEAHIEQALQETERIINASGVGS